MRFLHKIGAKVAIALIDVLPARHSPATSDAEPIIQSPDRLDELEIESGGAVGVRRELEARYTGPVAGIHTQIEIMTRAKGKGLRFRNACLTDTRRECEEFITARTK